MSSRDDILSRIRRNQPAPRPAPRIPTFDREIGSPLETFRASLLRMGGKFVDAPANGDLTATIRGLFPDANVICSAAPEVSGNRRLDQVGAPAELDDVDVGVVRAVYGVVETGSVWLTDKEFKVNTLGFLSQHLVVLLDPASLVPDMHHAYRRRSDFDAAYGVFMTGPSATADIEGVLIHGAQGIRSLTVIPVPAHRGDMATEGRMA
jgi:L-lactate dehydrogenase complex protein LldG